MAARGPLPDNADLSIGLLSAAAQLGPADGWVNTGSFAGVTWNPRFAPIIMAATQAYLIHGSTVALADFHPRRRRSASSASDETPPPSPGPLQPGAVPAIPLPDDQLSWEELEDPGKGPRSPPHTAPGGQGAAASGDAAALPDLLVPGTINNLRGGSPATSVELPDHAVVQLPAVGGEKCRTLQCRVVAIVSDDEAAMLIQNAVGVVTDPQTRVRSWFLPYHIFEKEP